MRVKGIVIGAGIVGSAIAYELSRLGVDDLHVLDPDLRGAFSSSERNGGGLRHYWEHPVNVELARATISLCESHQSAVEYRPHGYLWLFTDDSAAEGETMLAHALANGLPYYPLARKEISTKYPFIDKTGDLAFGVFGPKDGFVNASALKTFFRDAAQKRGVAFHDQRWVTQVESDRTRRRIQVMEIPDLPTAQAYLQHPAEIGKGHPSETWEAEFVVIANGAWAKQLLSPLVGNSRIKPFRRQLVRIKCHGFDPSPYGMVIDPSGVFFRPEGRNLIAGLITKDEPSAYRFDYDATFFEEQIWPPLFERSRHFENLKAISGSSGLYSHTPDNSGIIGEVAQAPRVFEAHSFTGRGIMQSYGVAIAVSDLVTKHHFERIDASALSRHRFATGDEIFLVPEKVGP
jgi:FAD-dependent oxidoreductase domain-containing protein 1